MPGTRSRMLRSGALRGERPAGLQGRVEGFGDCGASSSTTGMVAYVVWLLEDSESWMLFGQGCDINCKLHSHNCLKKQVLVSG